MANKIPYSYGQLVGVCEFLYDTKMAPGRSRMAMFRCLACGKEFESYVQSVRRHETKSCGCLQKMLMSRRTKTHGLTGHPLHRKWLGIKRRCYYKKGDHYKYYGARGIKVCEEWLNDSELFINHVTLLPHALEDGYTIDRIDNDGDYEPGNIRWATMAQQNANKRMNNQHTVKK